MTQAYEDDKGRQALVQFVRDQLEALGAEPQPVHHLIAGLTDCNVLATICFDRRLERAFENAERPLDVIIGNVDVAFEDEDKAQLYKLRGSVERAESLVLTEDDYETFFEDQASISAVLQGYLARKTILFVGYDLADPHFKRFYRKVTGPFDKYARRAYAFGTALPPKVARWCKRRNIEVIEADTTTFLEALTKQLEARARPSPAIQSRTTKEPVAPLPKRPYKLLDYYEAKDAAIFFGRQQETQKLTSLIHAHRLVLLFGASGVGKTSLLLAGAVPRLESAKPSYETIYVRALEDPALVIRRTTRRRLPEADLPEDGSLVDFLDAAAKALDCTLVIVLDQFEEFFIRLRPQFRAGFIARLGALYDARDVPVKVVLSLREDFLAEVSEIEKRIPEVFRTRMRLLALTRDQAHQAITMPVERLGASYEPALVEQLLDDLMGSEGIVVQPPQLQLVCSALFDELGPDESLITLAAYERLGSARGVLQKYLDDELARLGRDERTLARGVLEELVTSRGTKAMKAGDELALPLDVELSDVSPVLEKLVRARLLRALEREDSGIAYELSHEYLIREISPRPEAQRRKQAEELIKQEVENWQRFGTLLASDKLALVNEVREMLRLNAETQDFLLRSALQVGYEVNYWLSRIDDLERRLAVLADGAHSELAVIRRRATDAIGQLVKLNSEMAPQVPRVLVRQLIDEDSDVRNSAAEVLGQVTAADLKVTTQVIDALLKLLISEDDSVRASAANALGQVGVANPEASSQVADTLVGLLTDENSDVRISAGNALGQMGATNSEIAPQVAETLVGRLASERHSVRWSLERDLAQVLAVNLELIPRILKVLVRLQTDEAIIARHDTARVWSQVVETKPEVAPQVAEILIRQLSDQDTDVRANALEGLGHVLMFSDVCTNFIEGLGIEGLGYVWTVSPETALQIAKSVIERLSDEDDSVREIATGVLAKVGTANLELALEATGPLTKRLLDENPQVGLQAAHALIKVVTANPAVILPVIQSLVKLLTDENWDVYWQSRIPLAWKEIVAANPEAVPHVTEALVKLLADKDEDIRFKTLYTIYRVAADNSDVATPQVAEALIGLQTDTDSDIRGLVADTLGRVAIANPELAPMVIENLIGLVTDQDSDVRAAVAEALGQVAMAHPEMATTEVASVLAKLQSDEDSDVCTNAKNALKQIVAANPEVAPLAGGV